MHNLRMNLFISDSKLWCYEMLLHIIISRQHSWHCWKANPTPSLNLLIKMDAWVSPGMAKRALQYLLWVSFIVKTAIWSTQLVHVWNKGTCKFLENILYQIFCLAYYQGNNVLKLWSHLWVYVSKYKIKQACFVLHVLHSCIWHNSVSLVRVKASNCAPDSGEVFCSCCPSNMLGEYCSQRSFTVEDKLYWNEANIEFTLGGMCKA